MIYRLLELPKNKSFFLFGPRQTGKTTLIEAAFSSQKILQYNLLLTEVFQKFVVRPQTLREEVEANHANITHVLIDEIQKVPALLNEVQHLMHKHRINFVLTGSSSRQLKKQGTNLLGGRALTKNCIHSLILN